MIYNIHYDVCAMIISLFSILFVVVKKGFRKKQNKILFAMLLVVFGASFFDIFSSVGNSYVDTWSYGIRDFMNYGYLLLHNSAPYLLCCYIFRLTGLSYSKRGDKVFRFCMTVPFIAEYIVLLTNPFTKLVFYYNDNKIYSHGYGMYFLYTIALLYLCFNCWMLFGYGKGVAAIKKLMVYLFLAACLGVVIAQIIFPHLLLQLCVESLCLLGILFTVDNEDEIVEYITDCYNRRAFIYQNSLYMQNDIGYSVVILKLVNLNYYVSTMGIQTVNGFMNSIGNWLRNLDNDIEVYYCDNGHFAVICTGESQMTWVEGEIASKFGDNWECSGILVKFKTQLWTAVVPRDIQSVEQMLLILDTDTQTDTLQKEKTTFHNEDIYGYKREIAVEAAICRALKNGNFTVCYQPIWNAKNNKITSAEALLRLKDDILGDISPDEFIPIAEKKGYIFDVGAFVFEQVCKFYQEKHLETIGIEYIEVNLSAVQCMSRRLVQTFKDIVSRYKMECGRINLEITESAMVSSIEVLENTMKELCELGFTFSMDDYGTGYSNLSYIFSMPFQIVKVDKSILWNAMESEKTGIILSATLKMIRDMKLKSVVEGVETSEQKELLQRLECDYLQGFYFSKAVSSEEFYRYCLGFNAN